MKIGKLTFIVSKLNVYFYALLYKGYLETVYLKYSGKKFLEKFRENLKIISAFLAFLFLFGFPFAG
jgi:hypothetical protein